MTPVYDPVRKSVTPHDLPAFLWGTDEVLRSDRRPSAPVRILVAEDDFLVATQVEDALLDAGFDIAGIAATAEEAIALAVAERPSLVVMDVRLASRRDGIDAALELFRNHHIRCIFATAHADRETRERARAAEPLGWLQKPYSMDSLIEMIEGTLRHKPR